MKKLTNKGIGKIELMACLCAILVLLAIGIKVLADNHSNSNLTMFKKLGDTFAYKVSIYKDMYPTVDNVYYLDHLLDDDYDIELTNPTNTTEQCSRYESYVKIEDGKKSVVLKCGNYLAVGVQDNSYSVYELSAWQEAPIDDSSAESQTLYNYKKDGVEVSETYMLEKEFIDFYNEKELSSISSVNDVESENLELISKNLYRKKTLVKEID